jgi:formiminotetrahydrofolate cyclodeaminase
MHACVLMMESTMSGVRLDSDDAAPGPLDRVSAPATDLATGRLVDLTLRDYTSQVGEPLPRAGGGSVSAYAGSMAAALVGMVCQLTTGPGRAAGEALLPTCAAAETLRARLLAAVDDDTDAYLEVAEAYRLPGGTADERAARDAAMAAARRHAAAVPLATAEACLEVLELARSLSGDFKTMAASELAVAVQAAMTGVRGGVVDVEINLKYLLDADPWVVETRLRTTEIERHAEEALAATWPLLRDLSAGCAG